MLRCTGKLVICLQLLSISIVACTYQAPINNDPLTNIPANPTTTYTPFQPLPASTPNQPQDIHISPTKSAGETPKPKELSPTDTTIWIDPSLPHKLLELIYLPDDYLKVENPDQAALRIEIGESHLLSHWVYASVTPFPTIENNISSEDLRQSWLGQPSGPFKNRPLLVDEATYHVFNGIWGTPHTDAVKVLPQDELLDYAWNHRPSWGIIPFESIDPRWKVLEVNGISPVRKNFDPVSYALTIPISLAGDAAHIEAFMSMYRTGATSPLLPPSNFDREKLTTVTLTGVTALVRATAFAMEQNGIIYPGQDVREWLRNADITHISNEVSFAESCPYPNPVQQGVNFCSDPRYIQLLEDVGTDIIELTGDHFNDWGAAAVHYTIDLYRQYGWEYYGGGENLTDGREALRIEHNGNKLAFLGCNGKGGSFAMAGPDYPGAVSCDYDWMVKEIARQRSAGFLPIVTLQYFEYYTYQAQPNQERDYRRLAEAGAVIVSGSQAHQPQAFDFVDDSLIHYGLGNLFFDQYDISYATRQGFIDRHIFYDGYYINTELLTIMFIDYARPRPMTPTEESELLQAVFSASGW
jgi:poly-gamma-glutamate synthesis protein (capsule biosynthesis protein)